MLTFVIILQVLVAIFLIMVILLQPGNKGGASAALGGAGSDSVFGAKGANTFLSKITFGAATCFMITNIVLAQMSSKQGDQNVLKELESLNTNAPIEQKAEDAKPAEEATDTGSEKPAVPATEPQAVPASEDKK